MAAPISIALIRLGDGPPVAHSPTSLVVLWRPGPAHGSARLKGKAYFGDPRGVLSLFRVSLYRLDNARRPDMFSAPLVRSVACQYS